MTQSTGNGTSIMVQGRIVYAVGSLFEGKEKKDPYTNQIQMNNDGTPVKEYGFGLAIPKTSDQYKMVWDALHREAFTLYPSGQLPPDFAMKYKDGDGIDHKGQPFSNREGYAGCLVLNMSTRLPINYYIWENNQNVLVNTGIKPGDYVNVQLNIKAHPAKGQGKAGLYLNPSAVQLIQPGKEIVSAPSGDQIFGQQAPSYSGQVEAPAPGQMPTQAAPAMPQQAPAAAPGQMPTQAAPAMPQQVPAAAQPAPYHGVLPEQFQPQQVATNMTTPEMNAQNNAVLPPGQGGAMPPMP